MDTDAWRSKSVWFYTFYLTPGAIYFPGQPLERCRQPRSAINYSTFVNSTCGSVSRYQILLSVAASNITKRPTFLSHRNLHRQLCSCCTRMWTRWPPVVLFKMFQLICRVSFRVQQSLKSVFHCKAFYSSFNWFHGVTYVRETYFLSVGQEILWFVWKQNKNYPFHQRPTLDSVLYRFF